MVKTEWTNNRIITYSFVLNQSYYFNNNQSNEGSNPNYPEIQISFNV